MRNPLPPIGEMRQRVIWQTFSSTPLDGSCGQDVGAWTVQGTFWAKLDPIDGSEVFSAEQLKSIRPFRVVMRVVGALKAGDQLVYQGRTLTINSVHRYMERSAYLIILATEQAQGVTGGP